MKKESSFCEQKEAKKLYEFACGRRRGSIHEVSLLLSFQRKKTLACLRQP
jgi:hypothetical protein